MAVLFRSAVTPTGNLNANPLTIARPAGVQAGDFMVAVLVGSNSPPSAIPAGWMQIYGPTLNGTTGVYTQVFTKIATPSEPTDYSWVFPFNFGGNAHIYAWGQTLGQDYFGEALDATADTSLICPSATASVGGGLLVCIASVGAFTNSRTIGAPAGMTLRSPAGLAQNAIGCADEQLGPLGATGTRAFTDGSAEYNDGFSFVLMATPGGPRMIV